MLQNPRYYQSVQIGTKKLRDLKREGNRQNLGGRVSDSWGASSASDS